MTRKYSCYHNAIKRIIPAGASNKITLNDIIEHQDFIIKREHQTTGDFKKNIIRELRFLIKTIGKVHNSTQNKLVEEASGRGKPNYYYWSSFETKNIEINKEEISEERYFARAMVFSFIDEHFRDFFPPDVMSRLEEDVNSAHDEFFDVNSIAEKLNFIPSGIDVSPSYDISERNPKDRNLVFEALKSESVIKAQYNSLHSSEVETWHLSPQCVEYANHKVFLLGYIHETGKVKRFEIARLTNVTLSTDYRFKTVDFSAVQKEYEFEALVNKGVKNYFSSVLFGKDFSVKELHDGTWLINSTISIPEHFSKEKQGQPDPFSIANFLMSFADSIKVLKPDFLREEMKRRSLNQAKLYSEIGDDAAILKRSPHEQTGKLPIVGKKQGE